MTEDEFDACLVSRFGDCAGAAQLSAGFADRLVASAHRRRMRVRLSLCALLLAVVGIVAVGYFAPPRTRPCGESVLVAKDGPKRGEEATGIFFLGFIRECFRRARVSKKKEEEN